MNKDIALGTWSWDSGMAGGDQVFGNHLGGDDLRAVFLAKGTEVDTKGSWENPMI